MENRRIDRLSSQTWYKKRTSSPINELGDIWCDKFKEVRQ